jgi:acyl-lipid omega-6 desaturase (Delta-12 desaturase)
MSACGVADGAPSSTFPTSAEWAHALRAFRTPTNRRALFELLVTLPPFVALWIATYFAWTMHLFWASVPLSIVSSAFLVRLFLIQHDCGHGAFFAHRGANDWLGRCLGILTLTPYAHWRRTHAIHHSMHGNLDRRGVGDVDTLTVAEYLARPRLARWRYRAYRHPVVMFGIGPAYVFLLSNRVPAGFMRSGRRHWISTMGTNLAIVLVAAVIAQATGFGAIVAVHLPIVLTAAVAGVWLFYVQHQFEHAHWRGKADWEVRDAALLGSSHLAMPAVLRWFTANIGVHHAHHLSSGIPFYRLPDVLRTYPALAQTNRLTLRSSFGCAALALWDECAQRMVRFTDLAAIRRSSGSPTP